MRKLSQKEAERTTRSSPAVQSKQPAADELARLLARRRKTTTVATYRDDPLYPQIERVVSAILAKNKVVAPIDVLVSMNLLAPEKLEDWRREPRALPGEGHQLQSHASLAIATHRSVSRTRLEPRAICHSVHTLGEGTEAAAPLHQDRRAQT